MEPAAFNFASLGSGSKGNGTLIKNADVCILLDCGFTLKETESRLSRLAVTPESLTAILVTHEHGDHINGVGMLARKYDIPVYLTAGTWHTGRMSEVSRVVLISSKQSFSIGGIEVFPVAVPHDANEPVQYVFRAMGRVLGVLTDLGSITEEVIEHYRHCDALLLETNHCAHMLENGPYPLSLKQRVGGDWGHLSNDQAAFLLSRMEKPLKHLVLAHLSEQNNHRDKAALALQSQLHKSQNTLFACQQRGFDWLSV